MSGEFAMQFGLADLAFYACIGAAIANVCASTAFYLLARSERRARLRAEADLARLQAMLATGDAVAFRVVGEVVR